VLFESGPATQVIEKREASVMDEDIERFDLVDGFLNLR
jgi:hypothetical protein